MDYQQTEYRDELLPDKSVRRVYNDGRVEIRRRDTETQVLWKDEDGNSGVDEFLGNNILKRQYDDGRVIYGREQGYGRTTWSDGNLTINRSSFGGQVGVILAGVGGAMLLGALIDPPDALSEFEEAELRRQQAEQAAAASNAGGDWGDFDDFGDADFG